MRTFRGQASEIQRAVLVPNHTKRSGQLAEQCQDNIQERLGIPTLIQPTIAGGLEANTELFSAVLEPSDIVGGIFGDGTARDVLLAIGETPFISLAGGNARDIGRATHRFHNASPSWLIKHSRLTQGYALGCDITLPDGTTTQAHAISYIGAGETARQSGFLDTDEYRQATKGIRDLRVALSSLGSHYAFDILDDDGEERRLSDITFAKGSRMAKIGRFPIHHWDPEFRITPTECSLETQMATAIGLLAGRAAGVNQADPYTFCTLSDTLMHFDGEPPIGVPAQSQVTVGLSGQTYNLLTTRI
jgi:hypothetical protein